MLVVLSEVFSLVWLQSHVFQHCPTSGEFLKSRDTKRALSEASWCEVPYLQPLSEPRTAGDSGSTFCTAFLSLFLWPAIPIAQLSELYPCLLCSIKRLSTPNPPGPHLCGKVLSVQCVHGPATMPFFSPYFPWLDWIQFPHSSPGPLLFLYHC